MSDKLTPDEINLMQLIIRDARLNGIAEIRYKELHIRFNIDKSQTKVGPDFSTALPLGVAVGNRL